MRYYQYDDGEVVIFGDSSISAWAFQDDNDITKVTILEGVLGVDFDAFSGCDNLESVTFPTTVRFIDADAFANCNLLSIVQFNEGLEVINDRAFENCDNLEKISLPFTMKEIHSSAFENCEGLKEVTIAAGKIESAAFEGCNNIEKVTLGEGVEKIDSYAFSKLDGLEEVTISSGEIGEGAFAYCDNLEKVTLGEGVEKIDTYAFYGGKFTEIIIPRSVVSFGEVLVSEDTKILCYKDSKALEYAQENNNPYIVIDGGDEMNVISGKFGNKYTWSLDKRTGLLELDGSGNIPSISNIDAPWKGYEVYITKLSLPSGVAAVGSGLVKDLENLEDVYIPSIEDWISIEFENSWETHPMEVAKNLYIGEELANNIVIPEGITELKKYAFYNCDTIESIKLPDSLTQIGSSAFYDCDGLKAVTIPSNILTIGSYCFEKCDSLAEVSFALDETNGSSLYRLNWDTFSGCPIKEMTVPASVTEIYSDALPSSLEKLTIYNPKCTIDKECGATFNTIIYGHDGSTAEIFADNISTAFVDIETVHEHKYASFDSIGYCSRKRCACGKEITTLHVDEDENVVCDVCDKTTDAFSIDQTTNLKIVAGETPYLSYTPTKAGNYTFVFTLNGYLSHENIDLLDVDSGESIRWEMVAIDEGRTELTYKLDKSQQVYLVIKGGYAVEMNISLGFEEVHTHTYSEEVTKKATCTTDGEKKKICTACGSTIPVKIDKLGHNYSKSYSVDKKATTTANGSKSKHCTRSGCSAKSSVTTIYKASVIKLSTASYTYNGKMRSPSIVIKDSKGNVISSSNYTITKPSGRKKAGKYTYKITFKGEYSGTKNLTLTIKPKTIDKLTLSSTSYTYNGKARKPSVTVKAGELTAASKKTADTDSIDITYAKDRKNVGTYKVTVKGTGNYTGTLTKTFKINPKGISLSSVSAASKAFTVKWKKQSEKMATSRITGYQIQYSTSKKFTSPKTVTVKGYSSTSKKITKLSAKKTYYVRVRTYKTVNGTKYYSRWSSYKSVKTK